MTINEEGLKIKMYQRPHDLGPLDLIRIDARMNGIRKDTILDMLDKPPQANQKTIKEFRCVQKFNDYHRIMYTRIKLPLMTEREQLVNFELQDIDDTDDDPRKGKRIICIQSINHPDFPVTPEKVRSDVFKVHMHWQALDNPDDLEYIEFFNFDLKGYMPMRMMNMVISSALSKGIRQVHKNLKIKQQEADAR